MSGSSCISKFSLSVINIFIIYSKIPIIDAAILLTSMGER
jgi:hypothetical protein